MPDIGDLAKAIQLALAPVFLLTGIGALLNVMTGRLARIVLRPCSHHARTGNPRAAQTPDQRRDHCHHGRGATGLRGDRRSLRRGHAARALQVLIGAFFAVQRKIERLDCARARIRLMLKRYLAALSCAMALAVTPALARPTPDATFELSGGSLIGVGIPLGERNAALPWRLVSVRGRRADCHRSGHPATASGAVFHLGSLEDFNGFYYEVDMPVGRPAGELKNGRGVVIRLSVQPYGDPIKLSLLGTQFTLDREVP